MFDLEIINNECKYHDCLETCNLATSYYEDIKKDINKIKAYTKFKRKYLINGKKYLVQKIRDILKIYDDMEYLIYLIENTKPNSIDKDGSEAYDIVKYEIIENMIIKMLMHIDYLDFLILNNILKDFLDTHKLTYISIKVMNKYLYNIVKLL